MVTVGVGAASAALAVLSASGVEDSGAVGVSAVSATGAGSTGGAVTGAREASMELSLTILEDRVPQPPNAKPRTATTTTTGHTAELERTVSPLSLGQISVSGCTRLSLFAHGAESSLKTPVTPDLFRPRETPPDASSRRASRTVSTSIRDSRGIRHARVKKQGRCHGVSFGDTLSILLFNNGFCSSESTREADSRRRHVLREFVRFPLRTTQTRKRTGVSGLQDGGGRESFSRPIPHVHVRNSRCARPGKSRDQVDRVTPPRTVSSSIPAAPYEWSGGVSIVAT